MKAIQRGLGLRVKIIDDDEHDVVKAVRIY